MGIGENAEREIKEGTSERVLSGRTVRTPSDGTKKHVARELSERTLSESLYRELRECLEKLQWPSKESNQKVPSESSETTEREHSERTR